jgi:hypothetical protein
MHFLDIRIKSYGCLKFQGKVWAKRACSGANEKELTTLQTIWRQGGWAKGGGGGVGGHNIGGPMQGWSLTTSRPVIGDCWSP